MKALLKLIYTHQDAYNLVILAKSNDAQVLHKKHEEELTKNIIAGGGFSINFGGYGSFSNLGLGDNFHSKWYLEGAFKKFLEQGGHGNKPENKAQRPKNS